MEYWGIIKYLFLKELQGKEIYVDTVNNLHNLSTLSKVGLLLSKEKKFIQDDKSSGRPISMYTEKIWI